MTSATVNQTHYRFQSDGADNNTSTLLGSEDTVNTGLSLDTTYFIRAKLNNTGGMGTNVGAQWQANVNGGTFFNITTVSTNIKAVDGGDTDGDFCDTERLTNDGGAFQTTGLYSETGASSNVSIANGNEYEFCLAFQFVGADLTAGDEQIDFKILDGTGELDNYLVTIEATMASLGGGPVTGSIVFTTNEGYTPTNVLTALKSITYNIQTDEVISNIKTTANSETFNVQMNQVLLAIKTTFVSDSFDLQMDQNQTGIVTISGAVTFLTNLLQVQQNQNIGVANINFQATMDFIFINALIGNETVPFDLLLDHIFSETKITSESETFNIQMDQNQIGIVTISGAVTFLTNLLQVQQNQNIGVANINIDATLDFLFSNALVGNKTVPFNILLDMLQSAGRSLSESETFSIQLDQNQTGIVTISGAVTFLTNLLQVEQVQIDFNIFSTFATILTSAFSSTAQKDIVISFDNILDIQNIGNLVIPKSIQLSLQQNFQTTVVATLTGEINFSSQMQQSVIIQALLQTGITFGHLLGLASIAGASIDANISFGTILDITVIGSTLLIEVEVPGSRILKIRFDDRTHIIRE